MPRLRLTAGSRARLLAAAALLALAAGFLCAPAPAHAHVPVLEPARFSRGPLEIRSPDVSIALYGYLAAEETTDFYTFEVPREIETTVGIIVPARAGLETFHPELALRESGSPPVLELPDPSLGRPEFFEPFSLERFYQGPERKVTLEPGVRYVLEVGHGQGRALNGAYVVTFSGEERSTSTDFMRTLLDLPRIWLGWYGGGPLRPLSISFLVAALLAVLILLQWWLTRPRPAAGG